MSEIVYGIPDRSEWKTIILAPFGERPYEWTFHALAEVRGGRTKVFPVGATTGPPDLDRDNTLSNVNWMDISGGAGVRVIKPATDMGKTWWHIGDARGTDGWTCPPETVTSQPDTFTGNHVPLGRIGVSTYGLWGAKIHKWEPETQTWTDPVQDTGVDITIGTVLNTEGIVTFNGRMWFPLGDSGYTSVTEVSPGELGDQITVAGAVTPTSNVPEPTSNPKVWAFAVHEEKLWALTDAANGYALASSVDGATNTWLWPYDGARATFVKLEASSEPWMMFEFFNPAMQRSLWVSTRRGLKTYDPTVTSWVDSNLVDVPPHPDFGKTVKVWRPGEAAWVAGGGGDLIQYQADGTVVPASGPGGANQGMPIGKRGSVVSMASDLKNLILLVAGETAIGESASIVEDSEGSDPIYLPGANGISSIIAWTGVGFHPLWESGDDAELPTKVVVSDATTDTGGTDYRTFWGVGEYSYSMESNLTTSSARQAVELSASGQGNLRRFATAAYYEFGEFNAGTLAIRKLFSHAALFLPYASATNYAELEYQTNADQFGAWHSLGVADVPNTRVVFPFGLIDIGDQQASKGIACDWIKPRVRLVGSGGYLAPVVAGLSMAYMPLPADAATKTYTVLLPPDVDEDTDLTREQTLAKLYRHVVSEEFIYLKHLEDTYRAYVASVSETGFLTRDGVGTAQVTVIQIPTGKAGLIGE